MPKIIHESEISLKFHFPLAQGWDRERLLLASEYASQIGSAAVVVLHQGQLVMEWGLTAKRINSHSVRKSLLSALYGIAVERKLISLSSTLEDLEIDDVKPSLTTLEKQATVADLLKSRSGVYHNAAYETFNAKKTRPTRGSHQPGTFFYYNNWDFNALGSIFEKSTQLSIGQAFESWIANPIGMQDFRAEDVQYVVEKSSSHAAYPFWITARDLARFGLLYLNQGNWNEKQILPVHWIKESIRCYSAIGKGGYGYMWWLGIIGDGSYFASGTGGQYLIVAPKQELVIVNRVDTGKRAKSGYSLEFIIWFLLRKKLKGKSLNRLLEMILAANPSGNVGYSD
ncbi:MAG: serine hydrolase [Xenococcaceae cyanobacterium MO_188.B29]|nr:serine hydrolase [Xenococcaceae cyanobacterium MO_188.B29]